MESLLGAFTGGGGGGFNPFEERRAQEHYEDLYLAESPRHEGSLTHEGVYADDADTNTISANNICVCLLVK